MFAKALPRSGNKMFVLLAFATCFLAVQLLRSRRHVHTRPSVWPLPRERFGADAQRRMHEMTPIARFSKEWTTCEHALLYHHATLRGERYTKLVPPPACQGKAASSGATCTATWIRKHCAHLAKYMPTAALMAKRKLRPYSIAAKPSQRRFVYVAVNLRNCAGLLEYVWAPRLLQLIEKLGRQKVFVSLYESGSSDTTPNVTEALGVNLTARGIKHHIVTNGERRPRWNPHSIPRILFLSRMRNYAMKPFYDGIGNLTTHVLFLNDVHFEADGIVDLIDTFGGQYDGVCATDFDGWGNFYDVWVSHDLEGENLRHLKPWFPNKIDAYLAGHSAPVPVHTCWNGAVVFNASMLREAQVHFRPGNKSLGQCDESECVLLWKDIRSVLKRPLDVFINPNVNTFYTGKLPLLAAKDELLEGKPDSIDLLLAQYSMERRYMERDLCCIDAMGAGLHSGWQPPFIVSTCAYAQDGICSCSKSRKADTTWKATQK